MVLKPHMKWLCLALAFAGISIGCYAKGHGDQAAEDENMALIIGESGERYPIIGTGGITVSGGHHGMWMSNMKQSVVQIDGSQISGKAMSPFMKAADFTAAPGCVYFITQSATVTLPPAMLLPGQEVVVINPNGGTTITYTLSTGETLYVADSSDPKRPYKNSTQGKVDRFISDGTSWFKE